MREINFVYSYWGLYKSRNQKSWNQWHFLQILYLGEEWGILKLEYTSVVNKYLDTLSTDQHLYQSSWVHIGLTSGEGEKALFSMLTKISLKPPLCLLMIQHQEKTLSDERWHNMRGLLKTWERRQTESRKANTQSFENKKKKKQKPKEIKKGQ